MVSCILLAHVAIVNASDVSVSRLCSGNKGKYLRVSKIDLIKKVVNPMFVLNTKIILNFLCFISIKKYDTNGIENYIDEMLANKGTIEEEQDKLREMGRDGKTKRNSCSAVIRLSVPQYYLAGSHSLVPTSFK